MKKWYHLNDLRSDTVIILKEISKSRKWYDLDSSGSVKGEVADSCKCGNKTLGFIRDRELSGC